MKLLLPISFLLFSIAASAQKVVAPPTGNPNTINHYRDGYFTDSVFMFRPSAGVPTYSVSPYITAKRWPILAADTTNSILYWYNPATSSWISGGSGGQTGDTAYLNQGDLIELINVVNPDDSFYKPNGPDIVVNVNKTALVQYLNQFYTNIENPTDSANFDYFVFTIDATPNFSYAEGTEVLVAASGTTGVFVGKENWVAKLVGGSYTFPYGAPESGQQLILSNESDPDNTIFRSYRYDGIQWILQAIPELVGGLSLGAANTMGTNDFRALVLKTNDLDRLRIQANGDLLYLKFSGLQAQPLYFKPGPGGKIDTARFRELVAGTNITITSSATADTINATGGSGTQNWESTLNEQGDTPFDADHTVLVEDHSLNINTDFGSLVLGGESGAALLRNDDTSSIQIKVIPASDVYGGVGGHITANGVTNNHEVSVYPDAVTIKNNNGVTNLIIPELDSSAADADNIMWMDENDVVHRGSVNAGGGTSNVYAPLVKRNDSISQRYNVLYYGADNTGATDATAAIQAAINACDAAGGGVVYFPAGTYKISGALQTSISGTNPNSQIYIPSHSITSTLRNSITLEGEMTNFIASSYSNLLSFAQPVNGVILKSTISGSGTLPSVIGTVGTTGNYQDQNYSPITIKNITVKTYTNNGTLAPTMNGINFRYAATWNFINSCVTIDTTNQASINPSGNEVAGFIGGQRNNDGPNQIINCYVSGYKYGYYLGEHTILSGAYSFANYFGFAFPASYFLVQGNILIHACPYGIYFPNSTTMGLVKDTAFVDLIVDSEIDSTSALMGSLWYKSLLNIVDSGNVGKGWIKWKNVLGGTGATVAVSSYNGTNLKSLNYRGDHLNTENFAGGLTAISAAISGSTTQLLNVSNTSSSSYAALRVINNTPNYGELQKLGSAIASYKNTAAQDLVLYNAAGGNIAFLNDNSSGNMSWANGTSSAQMALSSTGGLTVASITGIGGAAGTFTIASTTNATKGKILFGTSAYDEANNRLGIGTASPAYALNIEGTATPLAGIKNTSSTSFAAINFINSGNDVMQLNKASSSYAGYRSILASDAGVYNGTTGNMSFLTDNASGDFNWAFASSTKRMTLTANGLAIAGSLSTAYAAKTTTYAILASDKNIDCTSGTFTVTLPTAASVAGKEYTITNSGSGTITIATTSSQTFTNITSTPTSLTLAPVGAGAIVSYTLLSTGAGWNVIAKVKNE